MTDTPAGQQPERQPAPMARIGDAERDRAVEALQTHMAEGRLDRDEFDERLNRALAARTAADLQPLFEDLPEPRPGTGLATTPAYHPPPWNQNTPAAGASPAVVPEPAVPVGRPTPLAANIVLALVWPAAVLLCIATGWENWWWFIVAAMIAGVVKRTYPGTPREIEGEQGDRHGQH